MKCPFFFLLTLTTGCLKSCLDTQAFIYLKTDITSMLKSMVLDFVTLVDMLKTRMLNISELILYAEMISLNFINGKTPMDPNFWDMLCTYKCLMNLMFYAKNMHTFNDTYSSYVSRKIEDMG